jgi:hypothetical protein
MADQQGGDEMMRSGLRSAGRLAALAPPHLHRVLAAGLGHAGIEHALLPLPTPLSGGSDPYGLARLLPTLPPGFAAVLVVTPPSRSPARLAPGPVVAGLPVGLMPARTEADLLPWLTSLAVAGQSQNWSRPLWAALAPPGSSWLRRLTGWMRAGAARTQAAVRSWPAGGVPPEELGRALAAGPRLTLYCGPGSARGWGPEDAAWLKWRDVAQVPMQSPCGFVVSLGCETLIWHREGAPFGHNWVSEGRACAYLGAVTQPGAETATALAELLGESIARGRFRTVGQLLTAVAARLEAGPELALARRGFDACRLLGNPLELLC